MDQPRDCERDELRCSGSPALACGSEATVANSTASVFRPLFAPWLFTLEIVLPIRGDRKRITDGALRPFLLRCTHRFSATDPPPTGSSVRSLFSTISSRRRASRFCEPDAMLNSVPARPRRGRVLQRSSNIQLSRADPLRMIYVRSRSAVRLVCSASAVFTGSLSSPLSARLAERENFLPTSDQRDATPLFRPILPPSALFLFCFHERDTSRLTRAERRSVLFKPVRIALLDPIKPDRYLQSTRQTRRVGRNAWKNNLIGRGILKSSRF